ncbi:MAG: methanogenesis marker 3 protein [Candidatus Verstraetearchaeota archaeon]|nr:methanogenesis marker 3 protein [Candidatus Verstraetearchaeota archaeon]
METVKILVDGVEVEACRGESLGELFKRIGRSIHDGGVLAVAKPKPPEELESRRFVVESSKGNFAIEVKPQILPLWRKLYKRFSGVKVKWSTHLSAAVGAVSTPELTPSHETLRLPVWSVAVSLAGFSSENAHLVFSKKSHDAVYGHPVEMPVLGRVVAGRHVVASLDVGDVIERIEPMPERLEEAKDVRKCDLSYIIEEPIEIYTEVKVELMEEAPQAAEYFLAAIERTGTLVEEITASYVALPRVWAVEVPSENQVRRSRGFVTVRNQGAKAGAVYFYKEGRPPHPAHSVVGRIVSGLELLYAAEKGDLLPVATSPPRVDVLGFTQREAEEYLEKLSLKQERSGDVRDEAIVVRQQPDLTLEAFKKGIVTTEGIDPSKVVKVRLFKREAPNTVRYFYMVTGLNYHRLGKLKVYFSHPKSGVVMFKGDPRKSRYLIPENQPKEVVKAYTIGVTNAARRFAGMIGVRMQDSDKYGPTAETFEGTNLIGEIVENQEVLAGLKDGMELYILEVE